LLRIHLLEQRLNVRLFRPTSLQSLDSFLYGRVGENMERVGPALQQTLSSTSDDYTLSKIRR
jgi:hypothetical protein